MKNVKDSNGIPSKETGAKNNNSNCDVDYKNGSNAISSKNVSPSNKANAEKVK